MFNGQGLQGDITGLINNFGDLGVFVGMLLESSIMPIPSEVVILGAGALGMSASSILIFGSLGATCGAVFGYFLGRYAAMPLILKFGKFVLIKPHHIYKAEAFARKYGAASVILGRILPVVPFKVFSIAAGMTKINFANFVICTLIGVIPRIYILTFFGASIARYKRPAVFLLVSVILIFLAVKITKIISNGRNKHPA